MTTLRSAVTNLLDNNVPWITDDAFLCFQESPITTDSQAYFRIDLIHQTPSHSNKRSAKHDLYLHATCEEDALEGLTVILQLPDEYYTQMSLANCQEGLSRCVLTPAHLRSFLEKKRRQNMLVRMLFDSTQSCEISRQDVGLVSCEFLDGGSSFVDSLQLSKFTIDGNIPFDTTSWCRLLEGKEGLSLALFNTNLNLVQTQALATAALKNLALCNCSMADKGKALIQAIGNGQGTAGLFFWDSFHWKPFDSLDQWNLFYKALQTSSRLTHLVLHSPPREDRGGTLIPLATALRKNRGLVHLKLHCALISDQCWSCLLNAISSHPTLRSVHFTGIANPVQLPEDVVNAQAYCAMWLEQKYQARLHRTRTVKNMLLVNKRIETMNFDNETYDESTWGKDVAPRIDCNFHRARFLKFQHKESQSLRSALLGRTLESLRTQPSLVFLFVRMNEDMIASQMASLLEETYT